MSFIQQYAVYENSLLTCASTFKRSCIVSSVDNIISENTFVTPVVTFCAHNDSVETDDATGVSGNVLTNDIGDNLEVVAVEGLLSNVGVAKTLTNGTVVTINADGSYMIDPTGCDTSGGDVVDTIEYSISNGEAEASATLTVTVAASAQETDPYWGNVVALIQPAADAGDGSTDITEHRGHTLTLAGGVCIKTTLGYPAIYFDGTDNAITIDTYSDFDFGTGNFTIDLLLYPLAYGGTIAGPTFWGTTNGSRDGYTFHLGQDANTMRITSKLTGTWADNLSVSTGGGPALNVLSHLAMERHGDMLTLFKDGAIVAQRAGVSTWNFAAGKIVIGRFWDGTISRYLNGYIRAIRATKAARWGGVAFADIPVYPFPTA